MYYLDMKVGFLLKKAETRKNKLKNIINKFMIKSIYKKVNYL